MNGMMQMFVNLLATNAEQVMSNYPQFKVILNQAQQSGMSLKEYAKQYAKQNNINIEPMLNMLEQRGLRF